MDSRRAFLLLFWLFAGTVFFAIAGTHSLYIGPVEQFFRPYYQSLVAGPTWAYMALLPVVTLALYWRTLGPWRSLAFLLAASLIGASSALLIEGVVVLATSSTRRSRKDADHGDVVSTKPVTTALLVLALALTLRRK